MSDGWNFADVWDVFATERPDDPALVHGDTRHDWGTFGERAAALAAFLLDTGLRHQAKVAQYLYNGNEYLESVYAAFKAGLVPVNTNYRYAEDELLYLWSNADVDAVVFHGCFADRIATVRKKLRRLPIWLWVDDGSGPCPEWATPYEQIASSGARFDGAPWGRSGDDIFMLYTGGTTGMPKGVMWRQDDLVAILNSSGARQYGPEPDLDRVRSMATGPGPRALPACPLMHGTGLFVAFGALLAGGSVVTLESRHFDVVEFLDTIQTEQVNMVAIVGDAFGRPMVAALDAEPDRWDLSSVFAVVSSGVMWSEPVKQAMLRHHPGMILADQFSSSEALGMGSSLSSAAGATGTARFSLGDNAVVLDDDDRPVEPGSGVRGRVAVRGRVPVGYYKDPDKSAATFPVIDGVRYSVPGDYATVEADGTITLLGRGSVCINTGGEKVFPEEVEEVLKTHPAVNDAAVVGVPDDQFGEAICAVVEADGSEPPAATVLVDHVKGSLAGYKAPRHVVVVDTIGRAPNGKVDYARLRQHAVEELGLG